MSKHLIKKWKGTRANYNILKNAGLLDPWIIYYVVDVVSGKNIVTEYFGENLVNLPSGQELAVNDVLETAPDDTALPYDRYLVGNDEDGYKICTYYPTKENDSVTKEETEFTWEKGVRILSKGLKNYVYFNKKLVTYDDVDCGMF